jgi:hypothetical protein
MSKSDGLRPSVLLPVSKPGMEDGMPRLVQQTENIAVVWLTGGAVIISSSEASRVSVGMPEEDTFARARGAHVMSLFRRMSFTAGQKSCPIPT